MQETGFDPRSGKTPHDTEQLWFCALEFGSLNYWGHSLQLLKPTHPGACAPPQEKPMHHNQRVPPLGTMREKPVQQPRPSTTKTKLKKYFKKICKLYMCPTAYCIFTMIDKTTIPAECLTCQGQNSCNMIPFFKENNWAFGSKLAVLDTLHPIRAYNLLKKA